MGHDDRRDLPAHWERRLRPGLRIRHDPDHLRPDPPFHPEPGLRERPGILPIDFSLIFGLFLEGSPGVGPKAPDAESFRAFLEDGGFPVFLGERRDFVLQELLRDVVQRDVAVRHGLRETRM